MVYCTDEMLEEYLEECFKEEDEERTWRKMREIKKITKDEISYLKSKIEHNDNLIESLKKQLENKEIHKHPERKKILELNIKSFEDENQMWKDEISGKKEFGGYY